MTRYFALIAAFIAAVATICTTVVTFSCRFFEGYLNRTYGFWRAEDSDGICWMYGNYYDDYSYSYDDSHLSTELLDGPMKYARAASMTAFALSICIFCSLFVTSAMKVCGTCCQVRKRVFRLQGCIMLFIALMLVTSFAALGSDLCREHDCSLMGAGYINIFTVFLWIGAAVMLFYVQDDDDDINSEEFEGNFVGGQKHGVKPQMEQAYSNAQQPTFSYANHQTTQMVEIDRTGNDDNDSLSV